MAENSGSDRSDNVVMPDITEVIEADPLSAGADLKTERAEGGAATALTSFKSSRNPRGSRVSSESNGVLTVPVSLPVGTLIAGTTFNVITSDQLPHFKPMLCVDNGFISGGPAGDELKSTHIVIQNPASPARPDDEPASAASRAASARSWAETANMPVLPIRCKNTSAELHKNRFGSGGRGRCIKYASEWYTPSEFEALCGRASSKDWKRSIRFGGRSIQALIDEGVLTPHATSCTCGACCDDQSAIGPVRLFTPYKRKRRNQDFEDKKPKLQMKRNISESDADTMQQGSNHSSCKEAWQSLAEGLDTGADYHVLENPESATDPIIEPWSDSCSSANFEIVCATTSQLVVQRKAPAPRELPTDAAILTDFFGLPDMGVVYKRLDEIGSTLVRLAGELKQCAEEARAVSARQLERLEHERAAALLADHVPLHSVDDADAKKCANCNREASAECSLCRRTPYCSTYCQKKDWAAHQLECLRSVPSIHADAAQHQSIMLIVESQHH